MKYLYLLLILLFSSTSIYPSEIIWSNQIERGRLAPRTIAIGSNNDLFFLIRFPKPMNLMSFSSTYTYNPVIESYNLDDLTLNHSVEIAFSPKNKKFEIINATIINGQPVIWMYYLNKRTKNLDFYFVKADNELLLTSPTPVSFIPSKNLDYRIVDEYITRNKYTYTPPTGSFDLKKSNFNSETFNLLVYGDGYKQKNRNKLAKAVFINSSLDHFNHSEIELPFYTNDFNVSNVERNQDGDIYVLGYKIEESPIENPYDKTRDVFKENIWIYLIEEEEGVTNKLEINTAQSLEQISMKIAKNGNIYVFGLTTDKDTGVKGSASFIYNSDLKLIKTSYEKFENGFLNQSYSLKKRGEQKVKDNLYSYKIDNIIEQSDGSFYIIVEQYFLNTYFWVSKETHHQNQTHYAHDIIVLNYSKNGDFQYKNKINRRNYSTGDSGLFASYFTFTKESSSGIIFQTLSREFMNQSNTITLDANIVRTDEEMLKQKTETIKAVFNSDGTITEEVILTQKVDDSFGIATKYSSQISDNKVILYTKIKNRGERLALINL